MLDKKEQLVKGAKLVAAEALGNDFWKEVEQHLDKLEGKKKAMVIPRQIQEKK